MRLDVTQTRGDGFTEVSASHNGKILVFNTPTYGRTKLDNPAAIFDEINGYWESLPKASQQAIFNVYAEVREYFDNLLDTYGIARYLKRQIGVLFSHMTMDSFAKWLLTKGVLYIPSGIESTLSADSRYPRADQTYLKEDYINLSTLALALRPLLPIWGEFIHPERQGNTNDLYKEIEAVGLVAETELVNWPADKPAFEKLRSYIEITAERMPVSMGSLWKGIGNTEIPLWLTAKVMVRRLTIVPLCNHQVDHSIIANIHRYVQSNLKPTDRNATDRVREKIPEGGGMDDDDKTSFMEIYKVKQRVTPGDAVLYDVYSENVAGIAQVVDPTIDLGLLEKTLRVVPKLERIQVYPHQIRLAQWVLSKAYSPRAFYQIKKGSVNRLLATAQALMWHWGFLELACFMQVERINVNDQDIPGIVHKPRGGSRISRKYDADLIAAYPHSKPQKLQRNKPAEDNDSVNRANNYAAIGINNLTRDIMRYSWYFLGPTELKTMSGQPEGRNHLIVPPKIKDQITELVLHIAAINQ